MERVHNPAPIIMNRRSILRNLALAAIAPVFTTSAASAAAEKSGSISVGETFRYDKDLRITFLEVVNDSRCPMNAKCISEGDAEILLRVKAGAGPAKNYRLHTYLKPRRQIISVKYPDGMAGIPKSYQLSIAELSPLPTAGKKTKPSDYRLKLAIQVAL